MKISIPKVLLIKLDRVNKGRCFYIILLCIGLSLNAASATTNVANVEMAGDSLIQDNSNVDKRQFDDLKAKYKDEVFVYERTIESSGWWTRFKQWLSDVFSDLFNFENRAEAAKATDLALKIGGVILFLLVIYFIFRAIINKEGSWIFGKSSDKNIIPVTDIESDIQAVDFKSLISVAENNNNFRLAIRYYYLWLLKDLTNAEYIEYDVEKTNSDYHKEIISEAIKKEFSYTSYLYNYIWYGEFNIDKDEFSRARHAFINFLNAIKA